MKNITMTMRADSCVLSVRPRANTLLAAVRVQGQGTTVSIAAQGPRSASAEGRAFGIAPVGALAFDPIYKSFDVVRSRSGRPPV